MGGTKLGGLNAAITNKAKCELARIAGAKGGRKSRRTKRVVQRETN